MLVISEDSIAFLFLLVLVFRVGASTLNLWKYFHGCICHHICCASQADSLPSCTKLGTQAYAWKPWRVLGECFASSMAVVWVHPSCGMDQSLGVVFQQSSPESQWRLSLDMTNIIRFRGSILLEQMPYSLDNWLNSLFRVLILGELLKHINAWKCGEYYWVV